MIEAIAKEDIPLIKKLLSVGFDPNKKREGQTPYLLWIMDKNNLEMIKMYLDAGANPNLTDEFGVTPLMRAVTHGNVDAVELLLRYNADKSLVNEWGETALSRAQKAKTMSENLIGVAGVTSGTMLDRYNKIITLLQGSTKKKIAYRKNYPKKRNLQIT